MEQKETIIEATDGTIKIVTYNKPAKKNAIDMDMYTRVIKILNEAAKDESISVIVLTGTGDYYSSGNDFTASLEFSSYDDKLSIILREYINAFIMFPKLLVAIVNGPAIGIAATTLALCDLVFASEDSYFYTPFTKLGIVAEGCSTFTFPRLIGERKTAEMLLYNHKMSAKEAHQCGFINYMYKPNELQSKVWNKIVEVSKLPKYSISATKKLIKGIIQADLLKANNNEMEELGAIRASGEYLNNIASSFIKKSKL